MDSGTNKPNVSVLPSSVLQLRKKLWLLQLSLHVVFASAEAILTTEVASPRQADSVLRTVV